MNWKQTAKKVGLLAFYGALGVTVEWVLANQTSLPTGTWTVAVTLICKTLQDWLTHRGEVK